MKVFFLLLLSLVSVVVFIQTTEAFECVTCAEDWIRKCRKLPRNRKRCQRVKRPCGCCYECALKRKAKCDRWSPPCREGLHCRRWGKFKGTCRKEKETPRRFRGTTDYY